MKNVIVVGSGIGGLSAAAYLVGQGYNVTVLEAQDRPGGKAGVVSFEDIQADTGPSILTLPEVFSQVFEALGKNFHDEITLIKPSPCFRYIYSDGTVLDLFHDIEESLASVKKTLGSKAQKELSSFLAYAQRIWDASKDMFIYGDAPTFGSLVKFGLSRMRQLYTIDATRPMAKAIRAYTSNRHLRDLLLRYATYNGSDPYQAPATLNCIAHVELTLGGYGIQGGIHALIERLVALLSDRGVRFHYQTPAEEIVVDPSHHRVKGVTLAGGKYLAADAVVANAEPHQVFTKLLSEPYRGAASEASSSASTSAWTGLLKASPSPRRAAHTVVFPEQYAQEFDDLFNHQRWPTQPTIYLCDQTLAHERASWPEHHPVFLMVNAPPVPAAGSETSLSSPQTAPIEPPRSSPQADPTISAYVAAIHERLVNLELCRADDPILWQRSPEQLAAQFPGSRGAIYGAASNSMLSAFQRPGNRVRHPARLYLASGGAHPGGGMPLCAASGRAAARAVIRDLS